LLGWTGVEGGPRWLITPKVQCRFGRSLRHECAAWIPESVQSTISTGIRWWQEEIVVKRPNDRDHEEKENHPRIFE